jgi:hypothetical protein
MRRDMTGCALWCACGTYNKQHDRVREIFFEGTSAWWDGFFSAINYFFPVLERLTLRSRV